jgi:hypothetical protein
MMMLETAKQVVLSVMTLLAILQHYEALLLLLLRSEELVNHRCQIRLESASSHL